MKKYLNLCRTILKYGIIRDNRTKILTKSIFGYHMRFNLTQGFPLLTTKKINFNLVIHELLWFIKGDTNIRYLVQNKVNIWNEWPYERYRNSSFFKNETLSEFIDKIKQDEYFAEKHGNLGPIYGKQWRDFSGIDQLKQLIHNIKFNPNSRRLIISAWNPPEISKMILPPCHILMQFYVAEDKLSLQVFQRSADVFLGIPFNISSYGLLLCLIAHITNLQAYELIYNLGDAHIYLNHIPQIKIQLKRSPKPLPYITLNKNINSIEDFTIKDICLHNYDAHGALKGEIAV
ncbi:thymidylate synthase [Candidatus Phytoplasma bonamiae]|uniref:Thymidylate synthase n=1 Tax=Candidatus Phytoplasma bonamiae TaxID=2982626 RepID=A0ABT9D7T1_9MOLU|nr:thymidylate synthase ['Bonamia sp.' little leaf phytoplasma]MDO8064199.1 thymidylate synthase ['Bonamia sp.' little leaf phytoplasma]MDV3174729.1 thymidylate synthase ['Bonamia sp.' little leaf phytoplasma]